MRIVTVPLGARRYDILIGDRLLAADGPARAALYRAIPSRRCLVIADSRAAPAWLPPLTAALEAGGIAHGTIRLEARESAKDLDGLKALLDDLLDRRIGRDTVLIALGGGVTGDLAGFAASIALRGLAFIQVPTTLLAQVDSAVGGKTGVNTRQGKNLVGSFHQPRLVLADTACLATLPERELRAGYAEVVKYGLIDDPAFFDWLEAHGAALLAGHDGHRSHAVAVSCTAKARIVGADEREGAGRALLNLGHTFAHALETASGYDGTLLHGEAVAIGLRLAFALSVRLGHCPAADLARVRQHLQSVGLPTGLPAAGWRTAALIDCMHGDKKAVGGHPVFILARGIGRAFVCRDVPLADVAAVLDEARD